MTALDFSALRNQASFERAASGPCWRAVAAGLAGLFRGVGSPWRIVICSSETDMPSRAGASPQLVLESTEGE